jgi:hypothetical protein
MKILSKVVLLLFMIFLATPTVVSVIEKKLDTSIFFSFAEEEVHKEVKEIKADLDKFDYPFIQLAFKTSKIISENLSKHDNVSDEIFSPPPELV